MKHSLRQQFERLALRLNELERQGADVKASTKSIKPERALRDLLHQAGCLCNVSRHLQHGLAVKLHLLGQDVGIGVDAGATFRRLARIVFPTR